MSNLCDFCDAKLEASLNLFTLPCGYSVCFGHIESSLNLFNCFICNDHQINRDEYFSMKKNKFKLRELEYQKNLNELIEEQKVLETIRKDPQSFIDENVSFYKNLIDLQREELKLKLCSQIDEYSESLIIKLNTFGSRILPELVEDLKSLDKSCIRPENNLNLNFIGDKGSNIEERFEKLESFKSKLNILNEKINLIKQIGIAPQETNIELKLDDLFLQLNFSEKSNLIDLKSTSRKMTKSAHTGPIFFIYKFKKSQIFTASKDGNIHLWDTNTGEILKSLLGYKIEIKSLAINEANLLASLFINGEVIIWRKDFSDKNSIKSHSLIRCIELYGDYLITGHTNNEIRLWDLNLKESYFCLNGHTCAVYCLKLFDKDKILAGSNDRTIKLWNLKFLKCERTFRGSSGSIWSLEKLSQNEFISGSGDGTFRRYSQRGT
ncbi:unnamed protein product [Brachionus calyciflorus]|uniref:Uncharacterized protein n=1 Tax=Brachionus calyciflorus TaxID=104777 RepID=A0A814LUK7_9BILA|nr:unnamed protein product [Brachionus calyciflorus]